MRNTIKQLINEHEVILHGILIEFAEIPLSQRDKPIQEFKDNSSISIALRHRRDIDVLVLDMAEGGRAKS